MLTHNTDHSSNKNTERFLRLLQQAEEGDALSQYSLGFCYHHGIDTEKNEKQAFHWYKQAANNNHAGAQHELGCFYYHGIGTEKNKRQAFHWYKQAANNNNINSQYSVACCYRHGIGTEKNEKQAFHWYEQAANNGHPNAQCDLGYCYEDGTGTTKNEGKAFRCFKKAAAQDNADGQYKLGFYYMKGIVVKRDEEKAFDYFNQSAKQGNVRAKHWIEKNISIHSSVILEEIKKSSEHCLPNLFPELIDQMGDYCGSAAFAGGCNHANLFNTPLYASLHEKKIAGKELDQTDLSDVVVAQLNHTRFPSDGPQFSVYSFQDLAKIYKIEENCTAVVLPENCTEAEYRNTLCDAFRSHHAVILSCDHDEDDMPGCKNGEAIHWVLGFGYWLDEKNSYNIAITHHGVYCKWPVHDLYQSNKQLPEINPHVKEGSSEDNSFKTFRFSIFKIKKNLPENRDAPEKSASNPSSSLI